MESEREERKRSIRAARDWLAGAEDALAGADDVSGDLKLMLARAELACTTSTRRARLRRRARILLPALALVALALWGLWYAQVQEPAAAVEERAEIPAAQSPVEEAPVPTPQVASAAPLSPHVTEGAETPAAAAHETPAAAPAVHESAAPPAAHAPASRLPSADMQHLMQVGGKILRE